MLRTKTAIRLSVWVTLGGLAVIGALPIADVVDPDATNPFPIAISTRGLPVNDGEPIFPEATPSDKKS